MKCIALVAIATATLGLAACDKPAATETTAAQDLGEANMLADNAVSLAEAAMDNAAVTDSDVTEEKMENRLRPGRPSLRKGRGCKGQGGRRELI